jgi:hypothetical protein
MRDEVLLYDAPEFEYVLAGGGGVLDESGAALVAALLQNLPYNQLLYLLLHQQLPTPQRNCVLFAYDVLF